MLYLTMIPTFALIYFTRSSDFYQSSAAAEAALADSARQLVEADMRAWYRDVNGPGSITLASGYTFDIEDVWIREIVRSAADSTTLNISFSALACAPDGKTCGISDFTGQMPAGSVTAHDDAGSWLVHSIRLDSSGSPLGDVGAAFPSEPGLDVTGPALGLRPEADAELQRYEQIGQATVQRTTHSFERMLYLSAITITTVGYGDVVPITFVARVLVASEAVLGIVVAGMFLNAIAHHSSRSEPD